MSNINDLLSKFTNLLNVYGPRSDEVKDFLKMHKKNKELIELANEVLAVVRGKRPSDDVYGPDWIGICLRVNTKTGKLNAVRGDFDIIKKFWQRK